MIELIRVKGTSPLNSVVLACSFVDRGVGEIITKDTRNSNVHAFYLSVPRNFAKHCRLSLTGHAVKRVVFQSQINEKLCFLFYFFL